MLMRGIGVLLWEILFTHKNPARQSPAGLIMEPKNQLLVSNILFSMRSAVR